MKDVNHKVSRKIVDIAEQYPNFIVVMEKLTNIRSRIRGTTNHNQKVHNWNFRQLQEFIEYKCHTSGIAYRKVPAYKTSSVCTTCGHLAIRRSSSRAEIGVCKQCGYDVNAADFLGAVNIVRRLFFYMGDNTGLRESSPDRGYEDPKAFKKSLNKKAAGEEVNPYGKKDFYDYWSDVFICFSDWYS